VNCHVYEGVQGAWPCTSREEYAVVTERYFVGFKPDNGWVVWDRYSRKNGIIQTFPRSTKGREAAHAECDRLNRQVRAREQS